MFPALKLCRQRLMKRECQRAVLPHLEDGTHRFSFTKTGSAMVVLPAVFLIWNRSLPSHGRRLLQQLIRRLLQSHGDYVTICHIDFLQPI